MRNIFFLLIVLWSVNIITAQDYKPDLEKLKASYQEELKKLSSAEKEFKNLKDKIDETASQTIFDQIKAKATEIQSIKDTVNKLLEEANAFITVLQYKKVKIKDDSELEQLVKFFEEEKPKEQEKPKEEKPTEPKIMYQFGDDKVISEQDTIFHNETFNEIFKEILKSDSNTYLGDFVIPQDGQKILISKNVKKDTLKKMSIVKRMISKDSMIEKKTDSTVFREVFFKSVKINAKHGLIQDIKIKVLDEKGNILLFENNVPITLLRYSRVASRNFMSYRHTLSNNKQAEIDTSFVGFQIKLADVLMYINNPGENYVPDELQLEYPIIKDGKKDNEDSSVTYEIRQDNSLENVLNLRTYTDFLGLFGDSPNGLIQIEGKADFYIAPFNFPNHHNYLFKKISPYINYARIDENERNISVVDSSFTNNLDILQKSYLNMGLDLDVFSSKFRKEFPFDMTLYATARYNVANLKETDSTNVDYKSLSLGGGLRIDVKRFNNFGLTLKSEMTKLDTNEFNDYSFVNNHGDFWVFRNEAEIFYHPTGKENQSIFLRLNTFNNATAENDEAFFQLQFGYRFSVGLNKVKSK